MAFSRNGSNSASGTGRFGGARQLVSLVRGMSIEEIEDSVREPPRLLFVSRSNNAADLAEELTGVRGTPSIEIASPDHLPRDLERFSVVVVHNPGSNDDFLTVRNRLGRSSFRAFDVGPDGDPGTFPALRTRIAENAGGDVVALGRWYPAFRDAAANAVIGDTSRSNAQFALIANVPTIIPMIGSLASAGADVLVLTKNQLLMAIKLAAIHGKPLSNRSQIVVDLLPVIGSGFVWRTIARESVGFLPFAAGTIPKVAIAYAGTFSTGKAVDNYYRFGKRPSREQLAAWYRQAAQIARSKFPGARALPPSVTETPTG